MVRRFPGVEGARSSEFHDPFLDFAGAPSAERAGHLDALLGLTVQLTAVPLLVLHWGLQQSGRMPHLRRWRRGTGHADGAGEGRAGRRPPTVLRRAA